MPAIGVMSKTKTVVITGAGSGLGLELTSRYLEKGFTVFACLRSENSKAKLLKRNWGSKLHVFKIDLRRSNQVSSLGKKIAKYAGEIDILINNAGIMHRNESIGTLDWKKTHESMTVNAITPFFVVKSLLKLIRASASPKIINLSSLSGAIGRVSGFSGLYGYKAGKAALNMMTRILAQELKGDRIPVVVVHPGTMKTKMGPENAQLSAAEASAIIVRLIDGIHLENTGKFLNFDGTELQW